MITYYQTGMKKISVGDYEGAVLAFSNEIELNPHNGKVYEQRALAKERLGLHKEAIEDYTLSITLSQPDEGSHYFGYYNRALARMEQGNIFAAIEDMDKVIELDPDYYLAYYHRAGMHCKLDAYHCAAEDLTKAIELKPDDKFSYYYRGKVFEALGTEESKQLSETDFEKAKELGFMKDRYTLYRNNIERLFVIEITSLEADDPIRYFSRNDEGGWVEIAGLDEKEFTSSAKFELNDNDTIAFRSAIEKSIPGVFDLK